MRATRATALLSLIFTVLTATGCQNSRQDPNAGLAAENARLRAQLEAANARPREVPPPPKAAPTTSPALAGLDTSYNKAAGTLTVTIPGDLLFPSGQAALDPASRATINRIADAIVTDYPDKKIRVDGYTDSDPVVRTKSKWGNNQVLSEARAHAVYDALVARGVPAENLTPAGHGPARPKATKAKSRRVEIVVQVR